MLDAELVDIDEPVVVVIEDPVVVIDAPVVVIDAPLEDFVEPVVEPDVPPAPPVAVPSSQATAVRAEAMTRDPRSSGVRRMEWVVHACSARRKGRG